MRMRITQLDQKELKVPALKRVAAYARVSNGKYAMMQSLSAQISYYSNLIQENPAWKFAGVFADEALSGTRNSRPEFLRMLDECASGGIDMIITKSISRFARNTVTLLQTVRRLKEMKVDVFFEEQNLHTLSGEGELMLTVLASFAEAESHSCSQNCKWRIQQNFKNGIAQSVSLMGYRVRKGDFEIIPEEAEVVQMVYRDYLSGMGRNAIQRKLTNLGVKAKEGKNWHNSIIENMLGNEKYAGDLLMQKFYRPDHLTKVDYRNKGEQNMYFIPDHHEGIIDRETFVKVQELRAKRRKVSRPALKKIERYPFTGLIVCGNCGKKYRRKTTNGRISWQCSTFLELGKAYCHAKQIPEQVLIDLSGDVLGLKQFEAGVFIGRIKEIRVPQFNHLLFIFRDGQEVLRIWQDRSRSESWTDEMRQRARQQDQQRRGIVNGSQSNSHTGNFEPAHQRAT